ERLIQTSSAHVGEGCDLDLATLLGAREPLRRHELVQRVVERAEIGIDLLLKVTGQESEPLAGFDSGARENEPADLSIAERRHAHRDGEVALPGAGRADREDEVVLADRLDVRPLIRRLRADALSAHRRRDDLAHLGGRGDRCVLRIFDEPLERGLAERLLARGERAYRTDEVADTRDRRGLAADAQLGPPRDDLHAELALEPVDVRLVVPGDEHHPVGVVHEERDLRSGKAHDARSFSKVATTPDTTLPSARPFVSAITFGITRRVSCGPCAPVSVITRRAISRIFVSSSCSGRYAEMKASSRFSLSARSVRPPLVNASIESRRIFACFVRTSCIAASSSSSGLFWTSHCFRAVSSLPSALRRSTAAPTRATPSLWIASRRKR